MNNAAPGDRPTERFTQRVGDYAKHRPSYPPEAIDAALAGTASGAWAADIGAGTGISTRLLLDRGVNVHAVEPNDAMRDRGERDTAAHVPRTGTPAAVWHATTGEHTGLPDKSVGLVLCAQSLHWLDPQAAMTEFARILTPGGRACALWNVHDVRDPMMAGYRDIVMRHAKDVPRSPWFRNDQCVLGQPVARSAGLGGYQMVEYATEQVVNLDALIGRAVSSSYMPQAGPEREAVERELGRLFGEYQTGGPGGGVVSMRYMCEVHQAVLGGRQE